MRPRESAVCPVKHVLGQPLVQQLALQERDEDGIHVDRRVCGLGWAPVSVHAPGSVVGTRRSVGGGRPAVEEISKHVEEDERLDVIAGAAGGIGTLIGLHSVSASPRALETAVACGDHLTAKAKPYQSGTGWLTTVAATQPVTGYSHGVASRTGSDRCPVVPGAGGMPHVPCLTPTS